MHYWINQYITPPDGAGGTRHYEFAARLKALGVDVTLVAGDLNLATRAFFRRASADDAGVYEDTFNGVPFRWLYAAPYTANNWRRYYSMARFAWSVFVYLLRVPVDGRTVFIGSSPHLLTALAACIAARLRGARFMFEVRDLWPESLIETAGRETFVFRMLFFVADYLYRNAERIVVLARGSARVIAERGHTADKIAYVPNSIDPAVVDGGADLDPAHPLPRDKFTAIYAGAHGPANGLDVVVEAARRIDAAGRGDIHIALIGDGPDKAALKASAAGVRSLAFYDPVPKRAVPGLLRACGAGLMILKDVPLFRYGVSPNKLFDYMGARLPVVTNVAGDCTAIVNEAGCGAAVPPADPAALATAIMAMADTDAATRRAYGAAGRAYVEQHYNREILARSVAALLA